MFNKNKKADDAKKENKKKTEKFEKVTNSENKKFKISFKTGLKIGLVVFVIFLIVGLIGHFELIKRDKAEAFNKSLNALILEDYTKSNKLIFDEKVKTDDEKAYKELVKVSKKIPKNTKYFSDVQTIEEYIDVLEEMKEIVKKSGGITITVYKKKDYKEITITETPFSDAIRYANEKIESLGKKENFIIGSKDDKNFLNKTDSKMIGFFINNDNILGDGDSYYDEN